MNREELVDVLTAVAAYWPHSPLATPADPESTEVTIALWLSELGPYAAGAVGHAVRRLHSSGREHAPTAGLVAQTVLVGMQGQPPSFDDLQQQLSRLLPSCSRYSPVASYTPEDLIDAVERLAAAGMHEAGLRFVAEQGLRAVKFMPDGSLQPLDANQQADRRDFSRGYQSRTVPDWRRDPQPGRALERARKGIVIGRRPGQLNRIDPHGVLGLTTGAELAQEQEEVTAR